MFCQGTQRKHHVACRDNRDTCVFCRITEAATTLAKSDRPVFQNDRLVVIPDIRPSAVRHFLVIPRPHIANTDSLVRSDIALVKEMREVGEEVLRQQGCAPGAKLKFGYHVPPFRSVDHLHLHCFELPHRPVFLAWKYWLPGVWITSDSLVQQLEKDRQRL